MMRKIYKSLLVVFIINFVITFHVYAGNDINPKHIYFNPLFYGKSISEIESQLDRKAFLFFAFQHNESVYYGYQIYGPFYRVGSASPLCLIFKNTKLIAVIESVKTLMNTFDLAIRDGDIKRISTFPNKFLMLDCKNKLIWEHKQIDKSGGIIKNTLNTIDGVAYAVVLVAMAIPVVIVFSPLIVPGAFIRRSFKKKWKRVFLGMSREDILDLIGKPKKVQNVDDKHEIWTFAPFHKCNTFYLVFAHDSLHFMYTPSGD